MAAGTVDGDALVMDDARYADFRSRYSDDGPSLDQLASNFIGAVARFVKQGLPVVSKDEFSARLTICESCPNWQTIGETALKRCTQCGCLKLKIWLGSEKCPIGKW